METKVTFKSLTQGRYHCNQTGEITKRPKSYALAYHSKQRNALNQSRGINTKTTERVNSKKQWNYQSPRYGRTRY